ncbi:MAG: signal peptidase I [Dehalococcoidia bacterium]
MRTARWRPLLAALGGLAAGSALLGLSRRWLFPVAVAGESMTPAFEDGDYVLVRRGHPPRGDAATGLVVCVRGPEDRLLLKRIVGIPGDSLRIGDRVFVGGHPLLEPYVRGEAPAESFRGVRLLHDDEYVVLGDHRAASTDSRDFGPVRPEQIEGIAWLRYWPPERAGLVRREARRFAPPEGETAGESGDSPMEG